MKRSILLVLLFGMSFFIFSCSKQVTVSFYEEEGVLFKDMKVNKGKTVNEPIKPIKQGMKFVDWYTNLDDLEPFDFHKTINEDLKLYAKWEREFDMTINGTKTFYADALWAHKDNESTTNLKLVEGNIVIDNAKERGYYESLPININEFKELVLSWNVRDLNTASIIFRVSVGNNNNFSTGFILGSWKKDDAKAGSGSSDTFASVSHDIITNKNSKNNMIKLIFSVTPNNDESFKINNISVTTKKDDTALFVDKDILENIELNVPKINQLSIPTIGNVICSPTSVTMVLNYHGYSYDAPTVAAKVKDNTYGIYGNWTFNVGVAGSHDDLYARVEYIKDYSVILNYLKQGIPVVLSINTKNKNDLPGALMAYPSGHLIVLIGFEYKDDTWYAVINDPAFYKDEDVRILYPLDQILKAHRGYSYIITKQPFE